MSEASMGMAAVKEEREVITIQIQIQQENRAEGQILSFETEKSVALRRVFLDFCGRLDLVYRSVRFLFDGERIHENQTAEDHDINDGDVIDAFYEMLGAGGNRQVINFNDQVI